MKKNQLISVCVLFITLLLSSCNGGIPGLSIAPGSGGQIQVTMPAQQPITNATDVPSSKPVNVPVSGDPFAFMEEALQNVYIQVNPSVVHIRVIDKQTVSLDNTPNMPDLPFQLPNVPNQPSPRQEGLGSGFVWDKDGHIVTNNHVISQAERVTVTFSDGTTIDGKVVGTDVNSDLAVVKVDISPDKLQPVILADSSSLHVGQMAIAIGNPFGLDGTMTVGIVSALERSLPVNSAMVGGPSFTIPDIIQTDAPINPGNSGGVLVNSESQVIGVTAAIESSGGSNSGIGFAIPSNIVNKVVPALIEKGSYDHPWLGIGGMTLNPDLAKGMGLAKDQRGVLIIDVVKGGPSDKAQLHGSNRDSTINGEPMKVGGDILIGIDNQPVQEFDDITSYLARSTKIGQTVVLKVLRDSKEQQLSVTLEPRPKEDVKPVATSTEESNLKSGAWLGVVGMTLTPEINKAINVPDAQEGVLILNVTKGSPAEEAGLIGGSKSVTINDAEIKVGGDLILKVDGIAISSIGGLKDIIQGYQPGKELTLTVLRDGKYVEVKVVLGKNP